MKSQGILKRILSGNPDPACRNCLENLGGGVLAPGVKGWDLWF